ncbi:TonB-dependent vitamin B12 receptor [Xanthomonas massiliensis]|uniref:TonB-dependent vitamin B12 receptor n=1 Tax=Xanthomonas massiliensis TaxID=1720302 RepID=UPI00082687C3|nr:TonB-dependent vitamin B12 receptor [Xanthomonas massiliensis]
MKLHLLSAAVAIAIPGVALADGAAADLDPVVVTATRTPIALEDSLAPVQVIDRADIEASQALSLMDLLRGRAGVDIVNQGGLGKLSSIFLRGAGSSQVLVLVDGVRVGSATSGLAAIQDLPPAQIERIEIVRGPASSLYGADAVGGVIQIFTRQAGPGLAQDLSLGGGSHGLRQASAGFSNRGERGWLAVHGAWQDSDGIDACRGSAALFAGCYVDEPDRDGYRNTSIGVRGGYALGDTVSVEGQVLHAASRNWYDGSAYAGNLSDNRQQVAGGMLAWRPDARVTVTARVGRNEDDADVYWDASHDVRQRVPVAVYDTRRDTASLQGDFAATADQLLSAGVDWQRDHVDATTAYDESSRRNTGVFAQYQGRFGAHQLQASVREDDNEQFGHHATGTLGYGFAFGPGFRLTASAGTGFRAPTFNDLYYPGFSNPALKPEKSRSANLGLAQYGQGWNWSFNAYRTRIEDMIGYDGAYNIVNIDKARIRGAELAGAVKLAGFDVAAQASWTDARNDSDGANHDNWLARRAHLGGRLDVDRGFGPLRLGITANGAGHRFDDAANSVRLAGYGTVDLRVEYALTPAWALQARAANVFDRRYETVAWYNQPGREYQLTLRYQGR